MSSTVFLFIDPVMTFHASYECLYQNALVLGFLRCFLLLRFLHLGQEYPEGTAVLFPGTHHVCHIGKHMMSACLLTT